MSTFEAAIETLMAHEGGYTVDTGGPTNFGISTRWYSKLLGRTVDPDEIKRITLDQAKQLYRDYFWHPEYEQIENQRVATKLFDCAVNMGEIQAGKLLQKACNSIGGDLLVDGIVGPKTVSEVNALAGGDGEKLLRAFCVTQVLFYEMLARKSEAYKKELPGWLIRARWPWR